MNEPDVVQKALNIVARPARQSSLADSALMGKSGAQKKTQVRSDSATWLAAWRELAKLTDGITKDCPRFELVMATLEQCDIAFLANNWLAFQQAVVQVRLAVQTEHER